MATPDLFDAYFQRADTDRDGRISGQEAVSFFQGANLNREVLAKIWQYADQGQTGYLSRAEFYNALKLVTVAQTGRELNPAIVTRALNGPAASQIPAPQIQFPSGQVPVAPIAQPQGGGRLVRPMGPSTPAYQQYPAANTSTGVQPVSLIPLTKQGNMPAPLRPANTPADWPTNKSSSWSGPASNNNINGAPVASSMASGGSPGSQFSGASSASGKSDMDFFGGDIFTAVPGKPSVVSSQAPPNSAAPQVPQPAGTASQMVQPRGIQEKDRASFSLVPSSFSPATSSKVLQPVSTPVGQQDRGAGAAAGLDASKTWPKMNDAIVRRYTKIFFEVDTDKDGKISGAQARDLFLSWHLPREVLKQIWDLSDQDHDSMLSLREFLVALYLMERHREGRVLPAVIPAAFYFDESGVQALRISEAQVAVVQNSAGYNLPAWRQNPGVLQASGPGLPPRPVSQGVPGQAPSRAAMQAPAGRGGFAPMQMPQANSRSFAADGRVGTQMAANDPSSLHSKNQEPVGTERKVQELEKQLMDSKEKMEFYRAKLQDIVLFKTRCDNRLAEITDKAAADKREVESLAKRYDEKYKQAGESQARLLTEEAAFRDIQERRLELHNALVRMEQGGDLNAFLQARADRLQNDLDELKKALTAKGKQLGLRMKPISLLEIPFGWQPGIQESACQWDDSWDKYEEEEFTSVQDYMEEGTAGSDASKPKSIASWHESEQQEGGGEKPSSTDSHVHAEETTVPEKDQQDASSRDNKAERRDTEVSSSDQVSSQKLDEKPSSQPDFDDSMSNGGEWGSEFSHAKDETESNASWIGSDVLNTKASNNSSSEAGQPQSNAVFDFDDSFRKFSISTHMKDDLPSFGPIRTKERPSVFFDASVPTTPLHSSFTPNAIKEKQSVFFDASVPSTPLHSEFSPNATKEQSSVFFDASVPSTPLHSSYSSGPISGGSFFDDSFPSMPASNNGGFGSTRQQPFARFDSFNSDFASSDSFARFDSFNHANSGPSRGLMSFDEPDTHSAGSFGGQHAKHSTDAWSAFS